LLLLDSHYKFYLNLVEDITGVLLIHSFFKRS
jgi:hypothetical protein